MPVRALILFFTLLVGDACFGKETPRRVLRVDRGEQSVEHVRGTDVGLFGEATLTISAEEEAIGDGMLHFESEDAWVVLESVRPSEVGEKHLKQMRVDGIPVRKGWNIRLSPWLGGTVIIPHGKEYHGLVSYRQGNFRGESRGYLVHKYYKSAELGEDEDMIESFVVKRGYMATLAENANGSGFSKVYVAKDEDIRVSKLPAGLAGKVSFIRVFPWRWTGKRGLGGQQQKAEMLDCAWRYKWDAGGESTPDMEYVPMRHNRHWDSFKKINSKENVTHLLGFNEPMQKDQSNMSMEDCLKLWPKLLESGLRLGSPCPTDGRNDWVIEFVKKADERGYRVDFVALHYYKADWAPDRLVEWLRDVHRKTGRPIWLTEFNNGASWTKGHKPSIKENAKRIEEFCKAMDKEDFIERYAIFNLGDRNANRQVFIGGELTETGRRYRDVSLSEACPENID
ncbi:glycosyl hydrolase [Haloferula sp.]|uniref:glycosyl hydrolase n=1 Tax=Haloferula sp. TaxID=2497595 RepID=UPI00329C809A